MKSRSKRIGRHTVEMVGRPCRLCIYSARKQGAAKWFLTVRLDSVLADWPSDAKIRKHLERVPKDAPIFVVCCSSAESGVRYAMHGIDLITQDIEDGKRDPWALTAGEIMTFGFYFTDNRS